MKAAIRGKAVRTRPSRVGCGAGVEMLNSPITIVPVRHVAQLFSPVLCDASRESSRICTTTACTACIPAIVEVSGQGQRRRSLIATVHGTTGCAGRRC